jgi:Phytanoyl-CoA dioxygenase (PhyH)
VTAEHAATQLREQGVVLLRGTFAKALLATLREAATRCFEAIGKDRLLAEHYRFSRFSHSTPLAALVDFGCKSEELMSPLSAPSVASLFSEALGPKWTCNLEQSWVRKKFAPLHTPGREYHLQSWHQDGALGVQFPPESGPVLPMTELLTCWIPLHTCGVDSPGLEFIRRRHTDLLHFTELDDSALRLRFPSQEFWAPALEFGDGLVFLNSVLHRTYTRREMRHSRLSVEYRIFRH